MGMIVTSKDNEQVRQVRELLRDRKTRQRERKFVAEGVRLIEAGLIEGAIPDIVLYNSQLLARTERGLRLLDDLSRMHELGVPLLREVDTKVMRDISDTVTPQGIVASFPFALPTSDPANAPLCVVADGLQDPGNLGTILRSAEAAGASGVWLSTDSVDVYSPKVVRAGMGAHFRLPLHPDMDWADLATRLAAVGVEQVVATAMDGAAAYYTLDWQQPSAIIVGNEGRGLSEAACTLATATASIPMVGKAESLNAAMATTIVLFEALRQRQS